MLGSYIIWFVGVIYFVRCNTRHEPSKIKKMAVLWIDSEWDPLVDIDHESDSLQQ